MNKDQEFHKIRHIKAINQSISKKYEVLEIDYNKRIFDLILMRAYLRTLVSNDRIVRYLGYYKPDILKQFKKISELEYINCD